MFGPRSCELLVTYSGEFHRCTGTGIHIAIVACVPKKVHVDGVGEIDFKITPSEITAAIEEGLKEPIEPEAEFEVPTELITMEQLDDFKLQLKPSFVSPGLDVNATKVHDNETGITQCRLSNGITINYKISKTETCGGVMRLIVGGGRAAETEETRGAVVWGVRTLSEGGRVGNFTREQVELFCVNHLINCLVESTEEFLCMEFRFTTRDNGMRAAFQLLHMVLEETLVDLLGMAGRRPWLPIVVCCRTRDELDAVCSAVSNISCITVAPMYSDLAEAERALILDKFRHATTKWNKSASVLPEAENEEQKSHMIVATDSCLPLLASGESPITSSVLINYQLPTKKILAKNVRNVETLNKAMEVEGKRTGRVLAAMEKELAGLRNPRTRATHESLLV